MLSLQRKRTNDQIRYGRAQLTQLRRQMLRYARSLPPGTERNERRQIAASLRNLFKNKTWFDANAVGGSVTEYRVDTVGTDGDVLKEIELDCPNDHAAVESAKQFIDGHDIQLWQSDRKVATFKHKPE
jgi:hypothetical protein